MEAKIPVQQQSTNDPVVAYDKLALAGEEVHDQLAGIKDVTSIDETLNGDDLLFMEAGTDHNLICGDLPDWIDYPCHSKKRKTNPNFKGTSEASMKRESYWHRGRLIGSMVMLFMTVALAVHLDESKSHYPGSVLPASLAGRTDDVSQHADPVGTVRQWMKTLQSELPKPDQQQTVDDQTSTLCQALFGVESVLSMEVIDCQAISNYAGRAKVLVIFETKDGSDEVQHHLKTLDLTLVNDDWSLAGIKQQF